MTQVIYYSLCAIWNTVQHRLVKSTVVWNLHGKEEKIIDNDEVDTKLYVKIDETSLSLNI